VPAPEITMRLLGGAEAAGSGEDIAALRAEVCGAAPHRDSVGQHGAGQHGAGRGGADGGFGRRFGRQRRQPGFVLAEARHGGYLVGYAFGVPLRPATSWWRDLTAPLPAMQPFDVIFLRNVLIYFDRETQERLFQKFRDALAPTGYLVLGKVETLLGAARTRFAAVDGRERIFRPS